MSADSSLFSSSLVPTEELRTLFVTGLPRDATEREIYLLCRTCPGYEGCSLAPTANSGPMAFCIFSSNANAMQALQALVGVAFDPDSPNVLRVELAKKNSAPKRSHPGGPASAAKRPHPGAITAPYMMPPMDGMQYAYPAYDPFTGLPAAYPPVMPSLPRAQPQATPRDRICTLFIAGLGATSPDEVRALFGQTPGIKNVKMKPGDASRGGVAWVQYETPLSAASAQAAYNGAVFPGSDGAGIRVEFAKSEMGA